jgi:hypothetical protein
VAGSGSNTAAWRGGGIADTLSTYGAKGAPQSISLRRLSMLCTTPCSRSVSLGWGRDGTYLFGFLSSIILDSYPIASTLLVRATSRPGRSRSTPATGGSTGPGTRRHGAGLSLDAAAESPNGTCGLWIGRCSDL